MAVCAVFLCRIWSSLVRGEEALVDCHLNIGHLVDAKIQLAVSD